ncbi:MAG: CU044_2847 family protein [Chloroflexi bacterium]|nr:CU044_2847 family protein [Chloroflexota bacterium]
MPQFIRYTLEDGSELLIEAIGSEGGVVRAGISEKIETAKTSFDAALDAVRLSALQIRRKLHDVQADEVEVKFGLKATGEIGNNMFAVGKAGIEANYEVTLKWKKDPLPEEALQRLKGADEAARKKSKA